MSPPGVATCAFSTSVAIFLLHGKLFDILQLEDTIRLDEINTKFNNDIFEKIEIQRTFVYEENYSHL